MLNECQNIEINAEKYFAKLKVPSWARDYSFSYTGDEMLELKLVYGSALHNWIRDKEEYDTQRIIDIFGYGYECYYSWEWVDTNTIALYRI